MLRLPSSLLLPRAPHKVHSGLVLGTDKRIERMQKHNDLCVYPPPNIVLAIKQERFKEEKARERKFMLAKGH